MLTTFGIQLHQVWARWAGMRIVMDGDRITRQVAREPDVLIRREEITRLVETSRGLFVYAQGTGHTISAPHGLAGYEELRARLIAWHPLDPLQPARTIIPAPRVLVLYALIVMAVIVAYVASNPWIAVPVGIVALECALWVLPEALRNPDTSRPARLVLRIAWVPLAILAIKVVVLLLAASL